MSKIIRWDNSDTRSTAEVVALLSDEISGANALAVTPTKVGYICMTTGPGGLRRKFDAKQRPLTKPGVVLTTSVAQVVMLADIGRDLKIHQSIQKLYVKAWERNILLGCILPWDKDAYMSQVPHEAKGMVSDKRENGIHTSCFVIKYGVPSEMIAQELWKKHNKLSFASSANPSGKGNRGVLEGVGDRIISMADLCVEADHYVSQQQLGKDEKSRFEQGVMVSFVTKKGNLKRKPEIIRHGLDIGKIKVLLNEVFGVKGWTDNHGNYY